MKKPWEWEEYDILELIRNRTSESIELDYTRSDALERTERKKTEISKEVSAFANSAGGTIVYGVVEQNRLPNAIDEGCDPNEISKEWLESVINSTIRRRIDGTRIKQIALSEHPGRVIYVVHIPQSKLAPHMASDHRYYKRFNFQSVPMEEYEVRDVANRLEGPDLDIFLNLPVASLTFDEGSLRSTPLDLQVIPVNESANIAEYALTDLFFDPAIQIVTNPELTSMPPWDVLVDGEKMPLNRLTHNWQIPRRMPIWAGTRLPLSNEPMKITFPKGQRDYLIAYRIRAPRMTERRKVHALRSTGEALAWLEKPDVEVIWSDFSEGK